MTAAEDGVGREGAPLDAAQLPTLFDRAHAALAAQRERIDELNVFPVPDGDTGTNMTATIRAALDASRAETSGDAATVASAITRGAVRGARGNSGVILSQVVRAVAEVVAADGRLDAGGYAQALERARALAYEAVSQPVEGTILTVLTVAADTAVVAADDGDDLVAVSARVCAAAHDAVERTRDQLEVLRDAGVVDAGARGLEVLLAAVHAHLSGQDPPAAADHAVLEPGPYQHDRHGATSCDGSLDFRYEVQYLLDADDDVAAGLRERLELLGDSVVVVAAGGLLNVHVHTDDVGAAIEEGVALGRPSEIAVTHFGDRLAALRADDQLAALRVDRPPTALGAVAVVAGAGTHALVRSLGAVPVDGAAGRLPSVADLLNACGDVRSATVVLLPGHANAVPTARQASAVAVAEGGRELTVIEEATTTPAVLAALAVLDVDAPAERTVADLRAAAAAVRCGEVVAAVRDADTPAGAVRRGQPLALVDGEVVQVASDPLAALEAVCAALDLGSAEIVTVLIGADATTAERRAAGELVRELAADDTEVEVVDAGQRPARFVVGVE